MTGSLEPTSSAPTPTEEPSPLTVALSGAGLAYLGLGIILGIVFWVGDVQSSLFPTGWLFPAILMATGALMTMRRRFDVVATLWGAFTLVVFMLGVLVYVNALDRGFDDAAAFDATIIVAAFGLLPLLLRPQFRS